MTWTEIIVFICQILLAGSALVCIFLAALIAWHTTTHSEEYEEEKMPLYHSTAVGLSFFGLLLFLGLLTTL